MCLVPRLAFFGSLLIPLENIENLHNETLWIYVSLHTNCGEYDKTSLLRRVSVQSRSIPKGVAMTDNMRLLKAERWTEQDSSQVLESFWYRLDRLKSELLVETQL